MAEITWTKGMKAAYLAGLWDGDGSITVWKWTRKDNGTERLVPSMVFVNTNPDLVEVAQEFLDTLGLHFNLHVIKRPRAKDCFQLTSTNHATLLKAAKALLPHLRGKKRQAELLIEFLESRKKQLSKTKNGKPSNTTKYIKREFEIEQEMRKLNGRGK